MALKLARRELGLVGLLVLSAGVAPRAWAQGEAAPPVETPPVAEAPAHRGEASLDIPGVEGLYLRQMHAKVHRLWGDNFIKMSATHLPKNHALNDTGLRVVLEVTLSRAGKVVAVKVKERSGNGEFDQAAMDVLKDAAPMPGAPEDVLSDDDHVHLTWAFARDHRLCGEVAAFQKESPLEQAIPRLLAKKRDAEALRRVRAALSSGTDSAVSVFAQAWLKRALEDKALAPAAAIALMSAGDRAAEPLVREAMLKGTPGAAVALAQAKVSICELAKEHLAKDGSKEQAAAVNALRVAPEPACVPGLVAVAENRKLSVAVRVAAIEALGASGEASAKKALAALEAQGPTPVKAAAILASAQPNGGRAVLYRLTPMLRDPSLDVRAAAVAGLLRSNGDAALEQLYLLFKEEDPRMYVAAANELANLGSAPSAELLARMLRKDNKRIRVAAAAALAKRSDAHARKVLEEKVRADADADVRIFAAAVMEPSERQAAAAASTRKDLALYAALLAGTARPAAADWLLANAPEVSPQATAELLGAWLAANTKGAVTASR